jgi:hypothetical protein
MRTTPSNEKIDDYQSWERTNARDVPGRYSVELPDDPVFALRDGDVLALAAGLTLRELGQGVEVAADGARGRVSGTLQALPLSDARAIFAAVDGNRTLAEVCAHLEFHFPPSAVHALLQSLAGRIVLAPAAIASLEARISHFEIVRFPAQSPYAVLREYWANCADVRDALADFYRAARAGSAAFASGLADLHVLACLGRNHDSYYGGAGTVPTVPGGYCAVRMRTGLSRGKAAFLRAELSARGVKVAIGEDRQFRSRAGYTLGHTSDGGAVFHHADPANGNLDAILGDLRAVLEAVLNASPAEVPAHLAYFHWLFLQAHPFYNVNNSIAMNIVNGCLARAGYGLLPHLLLDFMALRLEADTYAIVFRETLDRLAIPRGDAANRDAALARLRDFHAQLLATVRRIEGVGMAERVQ